MPYPISYNSPDGLYSRSSQQPTWAEYLAKYNQQAGHNRQAYRSTAPTQGYATLSPGMGMTMGAMHSLAKDGLAGSAHNYGEGVNSLVHGSDIQSDPNNTMAQQTYKDWLADHKSGVNLIPGYNNWRSVQSYQSYQRARREQAAYEQRQRLNQQWADQKGRFLWARGLDPRISTEIERRRQAGGDMTEAEIQQMYRQLKTSDTQGKLTHDVSNYFADQTRIGHRNQEIDAAKQNALAGLADQYNQLRVKQAQMSAARGMQGSSVDISYRGQLGRSRDAAAVGVENQAQQDRTDSAHADTATQQYLMSMINSGDPNAASAAQQQLAYINQMGQDRADLNGQQNQMYDISQFGNSLYSQALGGGLNAGANGINTYGPGIYSYLQQMGQ